MAEKIRWAKKYEIGVPRIDSQHQKLFELTQDLIDGVEKGKGRQILLDVLKSLIEYTKTHFVDEERIMKEVNFPEYQVHFREHEDFIKKVYESTSEFLQGHSVPTIKLTEFLYSWLVDHILIHDKHIGIHIRENNIHLSE
jgi:hemerythrin